MARRTEQEHLQYEQGYIKGRSRSGDNSTLLSLLVGFLIAAVLGSGAWFALNQGNQASGDTEIINVPTPQAPEAPKVQEIEINVPKPDVELPDVELPKPSEGSSNSESSSPE
ncbi:MAG: hypothetical protein WA902_06215 [Thermosynechococcaceae cyanobacterium]